MRWLLASLLLVGLSAALPFTSARPAPAPAPAPPAERLSPYGLAAPVRVVSGPPPRPAENTTDIPTLDALKDRPPAGFQFLSRPDEEPRSGAVGVHVPAGAVFQIQKRRLSNQGPGVVTLRLARSATRPTRAVPLEGKATADYNELRRAAADRAAGSPYPPKELPTPRVPKGTLVIVGGGGMTPDIGQAFLDAGGGPAGHFVVLPVSMPDPINVASQARFLERLGAKNVTVLPSREQKDLEDPKVLAVLEKATGIWFGGGRQWNFMDAYEGTRLPALFRGVLERGGVIGGSSAGATIQGDFMLRGAPAGPNIVICEGYERALGFLPGVAIDQHFSARKRQPDMTGFLKVYPQYLGIGLDEATAIVVRGSTAEVLGKGRVFFYDRRNPVKEGEPDYDAYPAGVKYDLAARRKVEPTPSPGR